MKTLAAIPLVANGLVSIPLTGYPNPVAGVLVDNQSGYNLIVSTPGGTIGPGIKDYIPVTTNQGALTLVAGSAQNVAWATPQIVPTIVYTTDPAPEGYPISTTQQVSVVGGIVEIGGTITVSNIESGTVDVASIAAGTVDISSGQVNFIPPLQGRLAKGSFVNGAPTIGPFNVQNAGSLGVFMTCGLGFNVGNAPATITINWIDSDGVTVLFTEQFFMWASPGGNGPFSKMIDVFPVIAPYISIQMSTTGPFAYLLWATSLAASFDRPGPQSLLYAGGYTLGAGLTESLELGTGGQTIPANIALPALYYVPGRAKVSTSGPTWVQIQEWNGASWSVVYQADGAGTGNVPGSEEVCLTRNTPRWTVINNTGGNQNIVGSVVCGVR